MRARPRYQGLSLQVVLVALATRHGPHPLVHGDQGEAQTLLEAQPKPPSSHELLRSLLYKPASYSTYRPPLTAMRPATPQNKVGEAEIVISTRPYDRSLEYLERISANTLTGAAATSARGAASPSPAASVEGPRPATATNPPRSPLATVSGPHSQPVMGDLLGLDDDGGGGGAEADRGGRGSAPASALEAPAPDSGLLGLADLAAAVPSAPGSQSSAGGVAGNGAQAGGARGAVWGLDVPQDGSDGGVSSVGLPPAALGRRPVTCVNLLRSAPGKSELVLTEHFQTAVSMARAHGVPVRLADFDWHGAVRAIGEEPAVEAFWHLVQPTLQGGGFCCGVVHGSAVSLSRAQAEVSGRGPRGVGIWHAERCRRPFGRRRLSHPRDMGFCLIPNQRNVRILSPTRRLQLVRFNCADSLDRTNVASYFCSVMVLQWMAGALGLEVKAPEVRRPLSAPLVGRVEFIPSHPVLCSMPIAL